MKFLRNIKTLHDKREWVWMAGLIGIKAISCMIITLTLPILIPLAVMVGVGYCLLGAGSFLIERITIHKALGSWTISKENDLRIKYLKKYGYRNGKPYVGGE